MGSEAFLLRLNVLVAERRIGRELLHTPDTGAARQIVRWLLDGWA